MTMFPLHVVYLKTALCVLLFLGAMLLGLTTLAYIDQLDALISFVPISDSMRQETQGVLEAIRLTSLLGCLSSFGCGVFFMAGIMLDANTRVKTAVLIVTLWVIFTIFWH